MRYFLRYMGTYIHTDRNTYIQKVSFYNIEAQNSYTMENETMKSMLDYLVSDVILYTSLWHTWSTAFTRYGDPSLTLVKNMYAWNHYLFTMSYLNVFIEFWLYCSICSFNAIVMQEYCHILQFLTLAKWLNLLYHIFKNHQI